MPPTRPPRRSDGRALSPGRFLALVAIGAAVATQLPRRLRTPAEPIQAPVPRFTQNVGIGEAGLGDALQAARAGASTDSSQVLRLSVPQGANPPKELTLQIVSAPERPTLQTLFLFLARSRAHEHAYDLVRFNCVDFARELYDAAVERGFQPQVASVIFEQSDVGHALNAFATSDAGLVAVDFTATASSPARHLAWLERGGPLWEVDFDQHRDTFLRQGYRRETFASIFRERDDLLQSLDRDRAKAALYHDELERWSTSVREQQRTVDTPRQRELGRLSAEIKTMNDELAAARAGASSASDLQSLNQLVEQINARVHEHNALLEETLRGQDKTRDEIDHFNRLREEAESINASLKTTADRLNALKVAKSDAKVIKDFWFFPSPSPQSH